MSELFSAAVAPANLFPTFLLALVLVYWLTVIAGISDVNTFDFDLEAEVTDAEVDSSSYEWLNSLLSFFNLGKVPFMIFLSFLALPFWVFSVLVNHYIGNSSLLLSLIMLIPILGLSLLIAKFLTQPFVKFFAALENANQAGEQVIGRICTVLLPVADNITGQASLKTSGAPVLLNIRTPEGKQLERGKTALVLQYLEKDKCYLVEPYDL